MTGQSLGSFQSEREKLNELVLSHSGNVVKRFYSLDSQTYRTGALDDRTKHLLGLVSSFVLRCDDCIKYHLVQCFELGVTDEQLEEALAVGLIVGGSITIPHLRRLWAWWEELKKEKKA